MEKFKDLEYKRPDLAAVKKDLLAHINAFKKAQTFEEADKALIAWNEVMNKASTMFVIASIRNTMNMKDEFYDGEIKFFNKTLPRLMMTAKKGMQAMLKSKFRPQLEEKYGVQMFKDAEIQQKHVKLSIILPSIKESNLTTEYSKLAASCSVDFMGEKCNFYGLLKHMESTDREERKAAFIEWAKLYGGIAPQLEEIYGKLVKLRCKIAKKLGYKSFIDYVYPARGRYDYDSSRVAAFREAVRKYITPVCAKLYEEQAKRIGVEKLCWYDESLVFPEGNATPQGTPDELVQKAKAMYESLSPETGEFFDFMVEHELFDFVTRENKHLGGYCTHLAEYKAPFIFSNFNGTSADIDVLTHEAGHAFEAYYASRRLPLDSLAGSTSEINEIHSMSMEHFAYPYMESFFGENADKYRFSHFCQAFCVIPYLVSVDEFQHRVFENPASTAEDWRRFWKETEQKYMPWRSYDGNEFLESGGFWMQKQHIFLYPFYYVDYALAQLGAFSLFRKKTEGGDAWGDYLKLCGMGGMYGYFETLSRAGIPCPLDEETVKATAEFAEKEIAELSSKL